MKNAFRMEILHSSFFILHLRDNGSNRHYHIDTDRCRSHSGTDEGVDEGIGIGCRFCGWLAVGTCLVRYGGRAVGAGLEYLDYRGTDPVVYPDLGGGTHRMFVGGIGADQGIGSGSLRMAEPLGRCDVGGCEDDAVGRNWHLCTGLHRPQE